MGQNSYQDCYLDRETILNQQYLHRGCMRMDERHRGRRVLRETRIAKSCDNDTVGLGEADYQHQADFLHITEIILMNFYITNYVHDAAGHLLHEYKDNNCSAPHKRARISLFRGRSYSTSETR